MKLCTKHIASVFLLLVYFLLSGCATSPIIGRLYTQAPRAEKEVALIYIMPKLSFHNIVEYGQNTIEMVDYGSGSGYELELLPGDYTLSLSYSASNLYGDKVGLRLQAEAGHVYYISPWFPDRNTWTPHVIDISKDEDYYPISNGPDSDYMVVKKSVSEYFRGERPLLRHK